MPLRNSIAPASLLPFRVGARQREKLLGYALIAPIILVIGLLIGIPVAIVFWDSLHNKTFLTEQYDFVGLRNYTDQLTSPQFWTTLLRTAVWTGLSVILQIMVGLAMALLLNRKLPGRALFRGLFLLPWVTPVVVTVIIWQWMFNGLYGIVDFVLASINPAWGGLAWFSGATLALPTIIFVNVWRGAPFIMIILLAGLQTVPLELLDAAAIDGAGSFRRFWHVTLPHLRATIVVTSLLFTLFNFNNFDLIYLTTQGGPLDRTMTLPVETYLVAFKQLQVSEASAISVLMLLVVGLMSIAYMRAVRSR